MPKTDSSGSPNMVTLSGQCPRAVWVLVIKDDEGEESIRSGSSWRGLHIAIKKAQAHGSRVALLFGRFDQKTGGALVRVHGIKAFLGEWRDNYENGGWVYESKQ